MSSEARPVIFSKNQATFEHYQQKYLGQKLYITSIYLDK